MEIAHAMGILIMFGLIGIVAFYQLPVLLWTLLIGGWLILLSAFGYLSLVASLIFWLLFLPAALFANLHRLRIRYIVAPSLKSLKKKIPAISDTEQAAIKAGHTWWEKDLFCGNVSWEKLFSIPIPALSQEEQLFINNQVEQVCSMIDDWQVTNHDHDLPQAVWDYLKREKFFGMVIPKAYQGLQFSALAHSTVIVKLATRSVSLAVNTMVPNSLGPAELLVHYGTDEQKNYYLPRLATGQEIPCFALTGREAGSDATALTDSGVVCKGIYNGQETLGIRLNWDKRYITLAPVATLLGLAFHLYDPDHFLGEQTDLGITLGLIPVDHPGVEIGNRHYPLKLAFMNGPTRGKNVFIPLDWIIGGVARAGSGWQMLMECLSVGRAISIPALSTACGKMIYRYTGAYARLRRQFNTPIANFEGIQESLSQIAGLTYLLEASRLMTAGAVDLHIKPSIVSAIAKYHMTEIARKVVAHAMDIHAGQMIQVGPRNFLANMHFAIPISITVEGANILTRNLIIFGQGAIRCHPYILKEIELINSATTPLKELDQTLMAHIGYLLSNFCRTLCYGLTGGIFIFTGFKKQIKNRKIRKYQKQLSRMSAALALLADISLILLGGSLKRRERISARLGDMLSELYLASAALKYYFDRNQPLDEIEYVCWVLQSALAKIQNTCDDLLGNYPYPVLAKFLHLIIFPYGRSYNKPKDCLDKKIIQAMLTPSTLRDRLTEFCYISHADSDHLTHYENIFSECEAMEHIWKKLQQAHSKIHVGADDFQSQLLAAERSQIITSDEAKQLIHFENLRKEIMSVNEFNFNLDQVIS